MQTIHQAAADFLAGKRIAVTGVSRTPSNHGGSIVYKRLRDRGYEVFAVKPNAETVEGDRSLLRTRRHPGGVERDHIFGARGLAPARWPAASAGATSGTSGAVLCQPPSCDRAGFRSRISMAISAAGADANQEEHAEDAEILNLEEQDC